jgi:hypothetical protein
MRGRGRLLLGFLLVGCGGQFPAAGPKLTLAWLAAPGAEAYVIEREDGSVFREIARVPATRTEYVDRTVQLGVEYCYQVRSRIGERVSPPSPRQCGTPKP